MTTGLRNQILTEWTLGGYMSAVFTDHPSDSLKYAHTFLSNACHTSGQRILLQHQDENGGTTIEINCAEVTRDTLEKKVDTLLNSYRYVVIRDGDVYNTYDTRNEEKDGEATVPLVMSDSNSSGGDTVPAWVLLAVSGVLAVVFIGAGVWLKK